MNKRLLLALYDRSGLGAYMPVDYKGHELVVEEHIEKFAELLVRECCQKLEDDGMVEVAIEMKQHFGVDGMSTEDKKTLIKELLGVKND